jgi:hypothetical protein
MNAFDRAFISAHQERSIVDVSTQRSRSMINATPQDLLSRRLRKQQVPSTGARLRDESGSGPQRMFSVQRHDADQLVGG